jgi:hypothetical protein
MVNGQYDKGPWTSDSDVGRQVLGTEHYDWPCAWHEAQYHHYSNEAKEDNIQASVETIFAYDEGEHDGPNWLCAFKLKTGEFGIMRAGCDYTGWDCRASGDIEYANNWEDLVRMVLSDEDRQRLGIALTSCACSCAHAD